MSTTHTVTLMEGDGIGPEVSGATLRVLDAIGVNIEWDRQLLGAHARDAVGALVPEGTLDSIRRNKVGLKAPITTPIGEGFPSVNVGIRQALELYACVRPVKTIPGVAARYNNVDLVVVRENTEDLYAGKEHEVVPGVIESLKIITEIASTRISDFAFRYAIDNRRSKVTAIHKANIMKLSDGLFLESTRAVSKQYPTIEYNELIVDNACLQLVMDPTQFDVILTPNLYGDIISDLAAGLVGGVGVVPGANVGKDYAVFEAVHGSWPDAAGKNVANPTAMMLTAAMMLKHLGEREAAAGVETTVCEVLHQGEIKTGDLGGDASTSEFTDAVVKGISA